MYSLALQVKVHAKLYSYLQPPKAGRRGRETLATCEATGGIPT